MRVSVDDPGHDADVNVRGTAQVLEAARKAGARVVFSSTGGAIYGEVETIPSPESTPCAAMAPYGVSKLCGEHYVELYNRLYGERHVVLRYGNVYGPRQDPHGEAGRGGDLLRQADRRARRRSSSATAPRRATTSTSATSSPPTSPRSTTAARTRSSTSARRPRRASSSCSPRCQRAAGTDLTPEHRPARLGELARSALDPSLAERELGWRAATPLADGLAATLRSIVG